MSGICRSDGAWSGGRRVSFCCGRKAGLKRGTNGIGVGPPARAAKVRPGTCALGRAAPRRLVCGSQFYLHKIRSGHPLINPALKRVVVQAQGLRNRTHPMAASQDGQLHPEIFRNGLAVLPSFTPGFQGSMHRGQLRKEYGF